uniref:Uncharacterized protein n=1 Tax=Manihot esculenta TaxID=3983 RepID=A0A2C9W8S4_MANES
MVVTRESQGTRCITVAAPVFHRKRMCQCWLLLVKPFNNKRECPKSQAALKKSLRCPCITIFKQSYK